MAQITKTILFALIGIILISACSSPDKETPEIPDETGIGTTEAFPSLTFTNPVDIQNAGDGSNLLYVLEQAGVIKVFDNATGTQSAETFLDIKSKVTSGGERGLLGIAFHPDYKTNGFSM